MSAPKDFKISVGSEVYLPALKINGTVSSITKTGKIKVAVGSLTVEATQDEIAPPKVLEKIKTSHTINFLKTTTKERKDASSVDLHGLTVIEALHALEAALSRALLANVRELKVVHGIGSGRVQGAVHEYLSKQPLIASFAPDQWNVGITRVFL
jgi:DNA mismatch repair protein MutS2